MLEAVMLWNEPNNLSHWDFKIDPDWKKFAEMVIAASQGGKWKTSLQLTGIICLMVHYHYPIDYLFTVWLTDFHSVGMVLIYLSLVPSLVSAVDYLRSFYTLDSGGPRG